MKPFKELPLPQKALVVLEVAVVVVTGVWLYIFPNAQLPDTAELFMPLERVAPVSEEQRISPEPVILEDTDCGPAVQTFCTCQLNTATGELEVTPPEGGLLDVSDCQTGVEQ